MILDADPDSGMPQLRTVADRAAGPVSIVDRLSLEACLAAELPEWNSEFLDLSGFGTHVSPGRLSWTVFRHAPNTRFDVHHTDTIDIDTVLAGTARLTDGTNHVDLTAGDCALIVGTPHAWLVGGEGCTISAAFIGAERDDPTM